ncbi:MAG: ParB-like nuclease domain-containing protein [Anaerolineae bacterium]|nr:ParB-like nuclease domain-containing protein [Anaerolineae bacterium]
MMWSFDGSAPRRNLADGVRLYIDEARTLFERSHWQGGMWRMFAPLRGQTTQLNVCSAPVITHERAETVPLARIQGTLNRARDFDAHFHPIHNSMEERWVNVAMRMLAGAPMPAVRLIAHGDIYYVVDGHHRVSVARMLGAVEIDAVVSHA